MSIMTIVMKSPITMPLTSFLSHSFWYPYARLSYGAYLCHSIFMLFRNYNSERGTWANQFEAILFFCAYLTFAYAFSLFITLVIEIPCLRVYKEFIKGEKSINFNHEVKRTGTSSEEYDDDKI